MTPSRAGYRPARHPASLPLAIALPAGALAAMLLMPAAVREEIERFVPAVTLSTAPPEPIPVAPMEPPVAAELPRQTIVVPRPPVTLTEQVPLTGATDELVAGTDDRLAGLPAGNPVRPIIPTPSPTLTPVPEPVLVGPRPDPRAASAFQPEYPGSEARREREGQVRLRVLVDAQGRVIRAERLSSTSDAFWNATERTALQRWRFLPGTRDGLPVEAWYTVTVTFRLER